MKLHLHGSYILMKIFTKPLSNFLGSIFSLADNKNGSLILDKSMVYYKISIRRDHLGKINDYLPTE